MNDEFDRIMAPIHARFRRRALLFKLGLAVLFAVGIGIGIAIAHQFRH